MRFSRLMPVLYILLGISISSFYFLSLQRHYDIATITSHRLEKEDMQIGLSRASNMDVRDDEHEQRQPIGVDLDETQDSDEEKDDIGAITDENMLTGDDIGQRIQHLKELYTRKMKYLADKKMISVMRGRRNCTKKLLESNPQVWCNDLECKHKIAPVGSMDVFTSIAKPLKAIHSDTFRRIQAVFGADKLPRRKYVFLLAVSENHYLESMATIKGLHELVFPHINNFTFYVYDMGITSEQKNMLEKYGKATVRKYPFHLFPKRISRLKTYTWKPILIQAHIDVGEFVLYIDASVRFKADLVPLFEKLSHTGYLMARGFHALALQTSTKMFSYFGDEACSYASYTEFEGAFIAFHNEEFSRKLLLEPWVSCALDPNCMINTDVSLGCKGERKYGKCHRYDLSAMTIMLIKLFREEISTFEAPRSKYHYVKQGRTNVKNYLEELARNQTLVK